MSVEPVVRGRDPAAAALTPELIDAVSICGPPDAVRDRLTAFRAAGVDTLIVSPYAFTVEEHIYQLQLVSDLAA